MPRRGLVGREALDQRGADATAAMRALDGHPRDLGTDGERILDREEAHDRVVLDSDVPRLAAHGLRACLDA